MLPELDTERLVLREIRPGDGAAIEAYQNAPRHWRLQAVNPDDFADGERRIEGYLKFRGEGAEQRIFDFVAHEKAGGQLVGQVSLERAHPEIASIGFSVAPAFEGRGYATEMARRIIAFGFDELGLHRIMADVFVDNLASRSIAEKIGMSYEGTARDCIRAQGRWWTEAKYAILAGDPR